MQQELADWGGIGRVHAWRETGPRATDTVALAREITEVKLQALAASFSFFIGRTLTFTVAGLALKMVS